MPAKFPYDSFTTPLGLFSVALDETDAVVATAFGDLSALKSRVASADFVHDPAALTALREQLGGYLAGKSRTITARLALHGTPFQMEVWSALRQIPFGQTRTYGEIAQEIGNPTASRAVGRANGANPICLLVPCHRVIGTDGSLTGFAFGEEIKRRLLELEGVFAGELVAA
jgi:methylated-DNA-[protein]-cysteine S-methyltransferase